MKKKILRPGRLSTAGGLAAALLPGAAVAGGIDLYEFATPDVGLASAGYAARAQDASTLFKNPAGMRLLADSQFQAGAQLTYGNVYFTPNSNSSVRLGNDGGGNAVGALPAGGLFYVQNVSDKVKVGLGMLSYFGLMTDYNNNWVGRYYVQQGTLVGMTFTPSVSYKVNDWLSVGAGLNAMYGYFKTQLAVNNGPLYSDGQMDLQDGAWGFGANVGVLVEPVKGTRIGVSYLSRVNLDFSATPSFSNIQNPVLQPLLAYPGPVNLGTKVPQSLMLSGYHELNAQWALMADFGWQHWSEFGYVDVGVDASGVARTLDANYQDTYHGALGAQFRLNDRWQFTGGVAYDSSAVTDQYRTVTVPMGRAARVGLGAQYQVRQNVNLGAAYEFLWAGNMAVTQGSDASLRGLVAGSYDNSWFSFVSVNLTWKF